VTII